MNLSLFPAEHTAATDARDSEFHPTPGEVVRALVCGMRAAGHEALPIHGEVRESAAGEGALVDAIDALVPSGTRLWTLYELRPAAVAKLRGRYRPNVVKIHQGDFLNAAEAGMVNRAALDITNPPWSLAMEWADAALRVSDHVAIHVPLATVETPERRAFFRRHPADLYPLEWRPNYDGRGGVQRAVAWIVWGPGRGGRWFPLARTEST